LVVDYRENEKESKLNALHLIFLSKDNFLKKHNYIRSKLVFCL